MVLLLLVILRVLMHLSGVSNCGICLELAWMVYNALSPLPAVPVFVTEVLKQKTKQRKE